LFIKKAKVVKTALVTSRASIPSTVNFKVVWPYAAGKDLLGQVEKRSQYNCTQRVDHHKDDVLLAKVIVILIANKFEPGVIVALAMPH
jgi:hypothetical protein